MSANTVYSHVSPETPSCSSQETRFFSQMLVWNRLASNIKQIQAS